jgi:type 1 glutamine amidotransferase
MGVVQYLDIPAKERRVDQSFVVLSIPAVPDTIVPRMQSVSWQKRRGCGRIFNANAHRTSWEMAMPVDQESMPSLNPKLPLME